ncbi:prepilin peptidase [Shewanella sairae]
MFFYTVISLLIIYNDVKYREIPNILVLNILLISLINAWAGGFLTRSLLAALIVLGLFILLWFLKVLGGGDVKLITAFSIGIDPHFLVLMLCTTGLLGGGLVVLMYLAPASFCSTVSRGIPYGIPIVLSGLFFLLYQI